MEKGKRIKALLYVNRGTDRQTDRQTDRRQNDRQTDRQTNRLLATVK